MENVRQGQVENVVLFFKRCCSVGGDGNDKPGRVKNMKLNAIDI